MTRLLIATAFIVLAILPVTAVDPKPVEPFNGKDLTGWKFKGDAKKSKWQVCAATVNEKKLEEFVVGIANSPDGKGTLLVNVTPPSVDIYTEQTFADGVFEVEFMIPKGSNSGVYLMGEYEVQVLDSYGKEKVGPGDMGGIYSTAAPKVNACKKPGEWQTFVIDFRAPKFADGKKVANARFVKVTLNGTVIHENVEMKGPTPGGLTGKEVPEGPLLFQGDHGPVAFRSIKITPVGK
jgi:hypothetical protein